mgnify:CR=1 FL=1
MRKGQASYLMLVYGFVILVVTLLLTAFMFSVRNPFVGKEEVGTNADAEINLLNYARTHVIIDGLSFTMADLIIYSYSKEDFSNVEEYTKNLLNPVYNDRCSYEMIYSTSASDFHVVNSIDSVGTDIDSAEISILGLNGDVIDVRLIQIC